jgi:hypothetical protein
LQAWAGEGRSGMRGDVDRAQHLPTIGIEGVQLVASSKPDMLTVIRDSSDVGDPREGAVLAHDLGG